MQLADVAQTLGNQVGMVDDNLVQFIHFGHGQLPGGRADADAGKDNPRLVADRRADAPEAGLMLAIVDGVATLPGEIEFGAEGVGLGEGGFGKAFEASLDHPGDDFFGLVCQDCLADAGTMDRRIFDHGIGEHGFGFGALDDDGAMTVEDRQMHGPARQAMEGIDDDPAFAIELKIGEDRIAELEQAKAEAIGIAFPLLLDKADFAHGGQQTVRGGARVAGPRANLGQGQRAMRGIETIEHARHLGEGFEALVAAGRFCRSRGLIAIGHILGLNAQVGQSRTTVKPGSISSLASHSQVTDVLPC